MCSIYHGWNDRNPQLCMRSRTIDVEESPALSRFSLPRLLMGCTKMILACASSLRASKKRDSEGQRSKEKKSPKKVCERWPWGTATVPGGTHIQIMVMTDRFPLARHSLSFLFHFFFLPVYPAISTSLHSHRRQTLVASRDRCCPCSRAISPVFLSQIYFWFIFDILIQRVTRYTDAVCSYVETLWIIGLLDVLLSQRES